MRLPVNTIQQVSAFLVCLAFFGGIVAVLGRVG